MRLRCRIRVQNKVVSQLYGSSNIGEHCYKVYRDRTDPCEDCKIIDVLMDGKERRGIRDITLPNGDILLVELCSAAIKDAEGNIIGAVEIARDVTEQKKAAALLNKTLLKQNEVLRQLNSELSDAAGYVKTVLPQPITSGPLITDWRFIPSASLGGDSFGYHWIDDDHFAMYLIDVSGHGWGASLLSVSVINVIRSQALPDTDFHKPNQVLFALNNTFPGEKHNDMFFTIWYGVYNLNSHELVYASGGHPPALLLYGSNSKNIQINKLRTPNFIMGGNRNTAYKRRIQDIHIPSRLYLFSDGVYDVTMTDGSIWGFNGIYDFIFKSFNADRSNLDCLVRYVQEMAPQDELDDDFTILEVAFE